MSLKNFIYTIKVSLLILFPLLADAQDNLAWWTGDTLKIEEVTIQASRKLTETGLVKTQLDSMVMKEKVNRSLSEMLSEHTPVFIKSYGRGSLATASFRGTASSHTKVTWNGLEINSPMLGMVDLSVIPVYFADEITLLHGSGSIKEAPGALGGLISLNTKPDWSGKFSADVIQSMGSYGTWDNYLKIQTGNSKFQSGTRIFHTRSNNNFRFVNKDVIDSIDLETGVTYHPVSENTNAGYLQYGVLQELYYRPDEKNILSLNFWGQKAERSIPFLTTDESGSAGGSNRQDDNMLRATGSWKHYMKRMRFTYLSGLNIQKLSYRFMNNISGIGNLNLISSDARSVSFVHNADGEYKAGGSDIIQVKGSYSHDMVDTYESVLGMGYNQQRGQGSLLLTWSHKAGDKVRTTLTIGEEKAGKEWSPLLYNISGEYDLTENENLYLRSGFARNVKFPNLNDLYYQPGGNPDLKQEISLNYEGGIHWAADHNNHRLIVDLNGYFTEIKNWILWLPTFKGYWEPRNIEKVNITGVETSATLSGLVYNTFYKLRVDYAFTKSINNADPTHPADISSGKQLPFIPRHSSNVMVNVTRNGWLLTWIWNYFSERYINTSNNYNSTRDYLYPYFMNQLTIGKNLTARNCTTEIRLGIHNIFNEEYRSVLQHPMPGRNYQLMLSFDL